MLGARRAFREVVAPVAGRAEAALRPRAAALIVPAKNKRGRVVVRYRVQFALYMNGNVRQGAYM